MPHKHQDVPRFTGIDDVLDKIGGLIRNRSIVGKAR